MESLVYFAFIVALALSVPVAVLIGLFAVGALFDALDNPAELKQRIEAGFRGTPHEPRPLSPKHYYLPYWRT
jgi:hypothetical protein